MPMKYPNAILSGISLLSSTVLSKALITGMPPAVSIELTNNCNLYCPECPSGAGTIKRERGFMDITLFRRVIAELKPSLINANLYFQGEPMLHPGFFRFIDEADGISTIVSTNGHFLNEGNAGKLAKSGLKKIIISLDGMDQQVYSVYRKNGNVDKVKEGITTLSRAVKDNRSKLKIEIQVLVNRHNENQLRGIRDFAKIAGAGFNMKSMQIYNQEAYSEWMPSAGHFRRYVTDGEKKGIRSSLPRRCARVWLNPVVTWNGKVLPCCFDKDGEYIMGDLNTHSFHEIWHGNSFREFRQRVLSEREKIYICRNCTSGLSGIKT